MSVIPFNKVSALVKKLRESNKKIVLVGGSFDILHPGHIVFLEKAKKSGDILVVLLESDEKIMKLKGIKRPFHNQKERANILSALKEVDFILSLPYMKNDSEYDDLIAKISPDVIAVSGKDSNVHHKRAAKLSGAKLRVVTKIIGNHSSSKISCCTD